MSDVVLLPTQPLASSQPSLPGPSGKKARKGKGRRWKQALFVTFCAIDVFVIFSFSLLYLYYLLQLPKLDQYIHEAIPQDTRIYDRNNVLLYDQQSAGGRRILVQFTDIPGVMQDAMTAIEDRTFWTNSGINTESILRAALQQNGGASTITQQVIKNLSHDSQHTFLRKLQEAVLAVGLTHKYTKAQILTMYFNEASFGAIDVGIEAAAETYFHLEAHCTGNGQCRPGVARLEYDDKGVREPVLGLARASFLAGMPNSPGIIDPTLGAQAKQMALARQKLVLQAMISQHMSVDGQIITPAMAKQAETLMAQTDFEPYQHTKSAPHFVDWVMNQLALQLGNGDYATGVTLLAQGGFTIRTTLDLNLEQYVERAVDQHLNHPDYQYYPLKLRGNQVLSKTLNVHSGAVVVLDAKTGEILAMDGSADYFSTNPAVGGQYNMAASPTGRPVGTTMAPLRELASYEKNTSLRDVLRSLGITSSSTDKTVGTDSEKVPLLQMAGAYQVLANNGQRIAPVGILDIYDHAGRNIYRYNVNQPHVTQVVSSQITDIVTSQLIREPDRRDTFGDDHRLSFADQDASCVKIVTCSDQVAAQSSATSTVEDGNTTIGYTPDVVVASWVGNINGTRMNSNVIGSTGAVAIWHSVIEHALGWCGSQPTSSPFFRSDTISCGPAPRLAFSARPARTFSASVLSDVVTIPPVLAAQAAYLIDGNTGNVLVNENGQQELPMASTSKIMTALVALQSANLDQVVVIQQDAVDEVNNNHGSSAQLVAGDSLTMRDLLYGLLLPSGDDAAIAIADAVAGSPTNFVALMNRYAQELHLTHTHYINPDGLTYNFVQNGQSIKSVQVMPEDKNVQNMLLYNYTSASDLVRLTQMALQNPLFAQIVQSSRYSVSPTLSNHPYNWVNTNTLLNSYPGATGVKTGSTQEAGACLVFSAV
ncbi:MAG: transglycosylase domain-containing protein, partial [Ktedonobacteraceae bacterium]|nr:transglycosylase domain-containing protein [Ktedonobacteraceae bacterium]